MLIAIIEDDENKRKQVLQCVTELLPEATVVERRSYQSGLREIVESQPDVIVLDMSMPTFDVTPKDKGGRMRAYAGRDILDEIIRRRLPAAVIVVTQYETFGEGKEQKSLSQLTKELDEAFPGIFWGAVYYHPAQSDWKSGLANMLENVRRDGERR